ncbi:MAG: TolC family protein [Verrucomicrobia bacterium]|nr:TolC family protein [Verrucomicrobiota bacterium]
MSRADAEDRGVNERLNFSGPPTADERPRGAGHWLVRSLDHGGRLAALLVLLAGCSTSHYRKSADKDVAATIAEKSAKVPNMDPQFTIEQTNQANLASLPTATDKAEFLGAEASERGARVLSLEQSLQLAVRHSRLYQSRKELVYLEALNLTAARHQFAPIFSARGSANYEVSTVQGTEIRVNQLTGQPEVVLSDSLVERNSVGARGSVGANWLIRDVGRISTAFTTDFFRFLTGDPSVVTRSQVAATFTRPLLRNAGYKTQIESLTLAERSMFYSLREFVRYRKQFSVDVAAAYYRVLASRDAARNTYLGYRSFKQSAARTRALVKEGRVKLAELGRLEQQELSQETSWIAAVRNYRLALDNFKIQLGLSTDANVVLDDTELAHLAILHPNLPAEEATRVALAARLDVQNLRNQLEDNERAVKLAADNLKPQLDLTASASLSSPQAKSGFPLPDIDRYRWGAGLDFDPSLDRLPQRNAYRSALIRREQAKRALTESEDTIKLQIREDWRGLEQARRSYENSEIGVRLSERRVKEQELLAQLGRGRAQDQVDAQNDLTAAKNQRTQTLVDHTVARLRFWEHLGILFIKENGQWKETSDDRDTKKP